jgi:membrane protein DedA with SNARE-associated domain
MLEIFALIKMSQRIAEIAREKGRQPAWFVVMLLGFWFVGEVMGAISGVVIAMAFLGQKEPNMFVIWLPSVLGALLGSFCAFQIAKHLAPTGPSQIE